MKVNAVGLSLLCLMCGWASAATVSGKVVVDGGEVYLVGESSVRVIGDAADAATFAGRLAQLPGEQVSVSGPVSNEALGRAIVPHDWVNPVFVNLTATVLNQNGYTRLNSVRVRGQEFPATGFLTRHTPENTQFEAYVFRTEGQISRIHLGRARVTYKGADGYVRSLVSKNDAWWIPLPPGNPTVLYRWTEHTFEVEDRHGKVTRAKPKLKKLTFVQGRPADDEANDAPTDTDPAQLPAVGITGRLPSSTSEPDDD